MGVLKILTSSSQSGNKIRMPTRKSKGARKAPRKSNQKKTKTRKRGGNSVAGFLRGAGAAVAAASPLVSSMRLLLRNITGSGDYDVSNIPVSENSIVARSPSVPMMHNDLGSVRITHREFLGDMTGSTAFSNSKYIINPADARTFPWLHSLAGAYEQYKLFGMVFEFVSTSGNALTSTNAALGSVTMLTQYDVKMPSYANKQRALNHFYAVSGTPAKNLMHAVECAPGQVAQGLYYIRPDDAKTAAYLEAESYDASLYDIGRLEFIVVGQQSSFTIGELWVTYDIGLYKPRGSLAGGVTWIAPRPIDLPEPEYVAFPEVSQN